MSESIKLQSTISHENVEIFEPNVSENNDSTQEANITVKKYYSTVFNIRKSFDTTITRLLLSPSWWV